ncbi:MAG TPA: hypothetical protein VIM63_04210 [Rhodoferax sp.]
MSPVEYISIAINGGYNGMDERKKFYAKAQQVLVEQDTAATPRGLPAMPATAKKRATPPQRPQSARKEVAPSTPKQPAAKVSVAAPHEALETGLQRHPGAALKRYKK